MCRSDEGAVAGCTVHSSVHVASQIVLASIHVGISIDLNCLRSNRLLSYLGIDASSSVLDPGDDSIHLHTCNRD